MGFERRVRERYAGWCPARVELLELGISGWVMDMVVVVLKSPME